MFNVCCPSCGFRKPKIVSLDQGKAMAKCPMCALNTGVKKSPRLAINAWNAMAQRMLPSCEVKA